MQDAVVWKVEDLVKAKGEREQGHDRVKVRLHRRVHATSSQASTVDWHAPPVGDEETIE